MRGIIVVLLLGLLNHQIYGQPGQGARWFDTIDDVIVLSNESNFDFIDYNKKFTIAYWIVMSTHLSAAAGGATMDKDETYYWMFSLNERDANEMNLQFIAKGTDANYSLTYTDTDLIPYQDKEFYTRENPNKWFHIAVTYDASGNGDTGIKFYINSEIQINKTFSYNAWTTSWQNDVSVKVGYKDHRLGACIWDEMYFFDYELTQKQIETLMNKGIPGKSPGLKASYHFDEKTGGIKDSSGNNNHGSVVGTLSVDGCPVKAIVGE